MPKFRQRPLEVEAVQWHQHGDHPQVKPCGHGGCCGLIDTLEGMNRHVEPGDWIVTDGQGAHAPVKPDIFEATYEPWDPRDLNVGFGDGFMVAHVLQLPDAPLRPGTVTITTQVQGQECRVMDDGAGGWLSPSGRHVTGTCDYATGVCRVAFHQPSDKGAGMRAQYRVDTGPPPGIDLSGAADDDTPRALDVQYPEPPPTLDAMDDDDAE